MIYSPRTMTKYFSLVWAEIVGFMILEVGLECVVAPLCINAHDDFLFWVAVLAWTAGPILAAAFALSMWSTWRRFRQST